MPQSWNAFSAAVRAHPDWTDGGGVWLDAEPLSRHTTFHIGGPADAFLVPASENGLRFALDAARRAGVRAMVIGRGSNLLFDDAGFRGAVISTAGLSTIERTGGVLTARAGAPLTALAGAAQKAGLGGLEFAYGIPGSVGGAVYMNAGAYGGEIAQCLAESRALDLADGTVRVLDAAAHEFGYRESVYRAHPTWIVLSASFSLTPGDPETIRAAMEELLRRRAEKQPLEYPSAGSVFKRLPSRYTAQMIDEAGLKGTRVGGAQVSEKHAGFIVNRGGATAADVRALIERIRETLRAHFNVEIETEIIYVPAEGE